jgi:hypothetical protein
VPAGHRAEKHRGFSFSWQRTSGVDSNKSVGRVGNRDERRLNTCGRDPETSAKSADGEILLFALDVNFMLLLGSAQIAPPSPFFRQCVKTRGFDIRRPARSVAVQHRMLLKIDKGGTIETSPADVTSED